MFQRKGVQEYGLVELWKDILQFQCHLYINTTLSPSQNHYHITIILLVRHLPAATANHHIRSPHSLVTASEK